MGCIELSDGISNRRIPVKQLAGTVRIELGGADGPRVVLPESVDVKRIVDAATGESTPRVTPP